MKMFVLFVLALFFTTTGFAGVQGFQNATNLGIYSKIKCDTDMKCANDAGKLKISTVGGLRDQVASSTTSLTSSQCGSTIVSNSSDVIGLPEASTVLGCNFRFVCGTADDFDINPADASDQIGPALNSVAGGTGAAITPAAGDAIRCTDIGSSVELEAVGANLWSPIGVGNGAWTDVN